MSNMSYCRFRNTRIDLQDCLDTLADTDDEERVLSKEEFDSCQEMFRNFLQFCIYEGIVEDNVELDDRLEEFFNGIEVE